MSRPLATGLFLVATGVALSGCGARRTVSGSDSTPPGSTRSAATSTVRLPAPSTDSSVTGTLGRLPTEGPADVAGLRLPEGRRLAPEGEVVAWLTVGTIREAGTAWRRLAAATPATGLVPLLVGTDDRNEDSPGDPGVAWWTDELLPVEAPSANGPAVDEILGDHAALRFHPVRTVPDPGVAVGGTADATTTDARIDALTDTRLALVPASDGAEALCRMGWAGNASSDSTTALATIVRSWQQRFGARVVAIGPRSLTLGIDRPPMTAAAARAAAEELTLVAPDLVWSPESLIDARLWTLRWR